MRVKLFKNQKGVPATCKMPTGQSEAPSSQCILTFCFVKPGQQLAREVFGHALAELKVDMKGKGRIYYTNIVACAVCAT